MTKKQIREAQNRYQNKDWHLSFNDWLLKQEPFKKLQVEEARISYSRVTMCDHQHDYYFEIMQTENDSNRYFGGIPLSELLFATQHKQYYHFIILQKLKGEYHFKLLSLKDLYKYLNISPFLLKFELSNIEELKSSIMQDCDYPSLPYTDDKFPREAIKLTKDNLQELLVLYMNYKQRKNKKNV